MSFDKEELAEKKNFDGSKLYVANYGSGTLSIINTTTNTVSNWTSFCIPISAYTVADSATITVAAFYNDTTCSMPYGPYGNSILYVDNLSFDNLITSVS